MRERFGSKHLRLFRLLLLKKHLEQKQISDMALIPNKETKEMLYSLLAEQFVSLQVIEKIKWDILLFIAYIGNPSFHRLCTFQNILFVYCSFTTSGSSRFTAMLQGN